MSNRSGRAVSRLPVQERRAQLLDLALDRFRGNAFEHVSIEALAAEANVSPALVYHYFGSKRGLYLEVVTASEERTTAAMVVDPDADPADQVDQALRGYLLHVANDPSSYVRVVRGAAPNDPAIADLVESSRRRIVDRILDALEETPHPGLTRMILFGWTAFVEEIALRWSGDSDGDVDLTTLVRTCHKTLDGMLAATGSIGPRVISLEGERAATLHEVAGSGQS